MPAMSFATLRKLALKNPTIAAFIHEWERGTFASLEQMLVGLSVHLAEQNERATEVASLKTTGWVVLDKDVELVVGPHLVNREADLT